MSQSSKVERFEILQTKSRLHCIFDSHSGGDNLNGHLSQVRTRTMRSGSLDLHVVRLLIILLLSPTTIGSLVSTYWLADFKKVL